MTGLSKGAQNHDLDGSFTARVADGLGIMMHLRGVVVTRARG
jgi:hypothetical protein